MFAVYTFTKFRIEWNSFSCTPDKDMTFYPWIENLILPMLSYPGRQVTPSYEIASKRIRELIEAYFKINKSIKAVVSKKKNTLFVCG